MDALKIKGNVFDRIEIYLDGLVNELKLLRKENIDLRRQLNDSLKPVDRDAIAQALRAGLANETGWRERARQVLGDFSMVECGRCGCSFPSGGHRKKFCGECE